MAAQSSASAAPPSNGEGDTSRLHIRSIKEMPAGHDAELATIFREMRRAADIPRERMAGRLATTTEIIDALESGAIFALPPWPELSRIVSAYTVMLGLDSRPLLRRLEAQLSPDKGLAAVIPLKEAAPAPAPAPVDKKPAPAPAPPAAVKPNGPPMPPSAASPSAVSPTVAPVPPPPESGPPPEVIVAPPPPGESQAPKADAQLLPLEESAAPEMGQTETSQKSKKRVGGILKAALNWLVLIGFVAALGSGVWYAAQHPRVVWTALDTLPEPIPRGVRSAWKFMRPLDNNTAGSQITDPGSRKSDKLP